jgi:serine/threonine-protein kinase
MTAEDDDRTIVSKPASPPPSAGAATARGPLAPGQLLGNTYEIEALLARGGMGEVYRARHLELGSLHAIKVILPELAEDTHIIGMFQEEARKLRRVRTDAIVAYEGLFREENGARYLVMELVDGPSLAQVMKRGKLSVEQVRALRDRCASGLAAAHDKGIFHRDISPDNIILVDGKVELSKIIDFGIAKSSDPGDKTVVGTDFAGKYSYVSPEQLGMYGGHVDARSDIYSLGLVLVAASAGRSIDMGNSMASVIQARQGVPDLSTVPAELRAEIAPMLEPDPAKRPASMRQLPGVVIEGGATILPTATPKPAPAATPTAPAKSGWLVPAIVGIVAFLAIAGGGAWFLLQGQSPPTKPQVTSVAVKPPAIVPPPPAATGVMPQAEEAVQPARPALPTRTAVEAQVQTILSRFDCAGLTAHVGDDLHGSVSGFARTSDLPPLRAALAGLGAGVSVTSDGVSGLAWPHCAVASLLGTATAAAPRITLNKPDATYHEKDKLILDLAMPSGSGGFLRVDFYDTSGTVQHLYPGNESGAVRAGQSVTLGKDGSYEMGAPFGPNMIVALLSPQRLFPTARPAQEDARAYLSVLEGRLKTVGSVGGKYVMIDTVP